MLAAMMSGMYCDRTILKPESAMVQAISELVEGMMADSKLSIL